MRVEADADEWVETEYGIWSGGSTGIDWAGWIGSLCSSYRERCIKEVDCLHRCWAAPSDDDGRNIKRRTQFQSCATTHTQK
jgi:hypothetical protein